jgi:hypothetical protein
MKPKVWGLTEDKAKLVMLGRSIVRKFDSTLSSSSAACLKRVQEFLTTVPLVYKVHFDLKWLSTTSARIQVTRRKWTRDQLVASGGAGSFGYAGAAELIKTWRVRSGFFRNLPSFANPFSSK